MLRTYLFAPVALCATLSCQNGTDSTRRPDVDIRGERIAAHVRFLASDLLEGRAPATRGGELTADYLATQFALAGAEPAGDGDTYFQEVPLVGVKPTADTRLRWERTGEAIDMAYLDDFVAVTHRQRESVEINAEAIFVGHGIVAPEFDWNDYKAVDVRGKVVVLFTNEPPSQDPSFFGGKALTYYGRWTFKYEEALRQGATGAVIIHTPATAGYPWDVVRNSWGGRNPYVKLQPGEPALPVAGWVTEAVAGRLFAGTGKTPQEVLDDSERRDFQPYPLGFRLRGRIVSEIEPMKTRNVLARVEGSDPTRKDEAVLYTAHWDHLGIGPEVEGDAIYNGAVDNATGCGVLLELARAWAEQPQKPPRSILFAAVTAEEGGLRGSEFYAQHPVVPAGKTAVNLNFDGLSPLGRTQDITLPGYERTTLRELVDETAREFGYTIRPDPAPEQGYYYRSDHFSLAKAGVPAFSLRPGWDFVGKPEKWGAEAEARYRANRYHQPSDEYNPSWDFSGLEDLARFGFELGRRVAHLPELPTWVPGDEFLPAREESWGQ